MDINCKLLSWVGDVLLAFSTHYALAVPEALCPSTTFDFDERPATATVTNAFPVVNIGDADLALGDARACDVYAHFLLSMDAKVLLQ